MPEDTPWWGKMLGKMVIVTVVSVLVLVLVAVLSVLGTWMYTVQEVVK